MQERDNSLWSGILITTTRPSATSFTAVRCCIVVATIASVLLGCQDLRSLQQLSAALSTHYDEPMSINVADGTELSIILENERYANVSPADRRKIALDIAQFALSHYSLADSLQSINIGFGSTTQAVGVSVSRTNAAYSWTTAALRMRLDSGSITNVVSP